VGRLKIALGIAVSVGVFAYLLASVDLSQLGAQLRKTRPGWLAIGIALAPIGLLPRAARWRYLFPPGSHPPGLLPAVMIGYMANNVLPLRAGEFVRVYVVARRWGHGFWTAVATLVVERLIDSLSIVLILAALVMLLPVPATVKWVAVVLVIVDVLGVSVLTFMTVAPGVIRTALGRFGRRWPALEQRVLGIHDTFVRGLDGVRAPGHIVPILLWTPIVWVMPALAAWTVLRAVDLTLPWLAGWAVLAFVAVGIAVPSAPGYVGVFHAAAMLAVGMFGVSGPAALGYAIVFHASQIVPVTIVGWVFLLREHMSLADATRARQATPGLAEDTPL
jgi:glycosyltransferase 2 family protein